ncbi:uncharacterized protein LOC130655083 isoform X2 [Hydractinia symbiolongicarpus]|uniref:uncharacterized protein LOC130655083 isoform X2 n=1 Tax=Hydractinia symbiolongicarpus TaxID=13093 RepID=UPI00254B89F3|nr:uncharacterized protein LOC130655083 isoform X2 [Hydractinia symbiolongicarpus]
MTSGSLDIQLQSGVMSMSQAMLSDWFSQIRMGKLRCPFDGCTWTFFTSFELADHVFGDCKFGKYRGNVPCTHCTVLLKVEELKSHWRTSHKDVVSVLSSLHRGKSCECPNYQCMEMFDASFKGCKAYVKHSILCRPLYLCSTCNREYRTCNIFRQHKCKEKMEKRMSVSKQEVDVKRNFNERPQLSSKEEQAVIKKWAEDFKAGKFNCPVPSCKQRFFVPNHFVAHLQREAKLDKIINQIQHITCPYCLTNVNWTIFGRHMQDYHREIVNYVNLLKSGESISCPNFKCAEKKMYTAETGAEYIQHAIECKPLYCCDQCGSVSKSLKYLKKHAITCDGTEKKHQQKKGIIKRELVLTEAFASEPNFLQHGKKRSNVGYGADKSLACNFTKKKEPRNRFLLKASDTDDGDVTDLPRRFKKEQRKSSSFHKLEVGSKFTPPQHNDMNKIKKTKSCSSNVGIGIKRRAGRVKPSAKLASGENLKAVENEDSFNSSIDFLNETSDIESLRVQDGLCTPIVIPSDQLESSFNNILAAKTNAYKTRGLMHKEIKRKVQESMHSGNVPRLKNRRKSAPVKSIQSVEDTELIHQTPLTFSSNDTKNLLDKWLSGVKKGIWNCVYPKCKQSFYLPSDFHSHIMSYPSNDQIRKKVFQSKIACCFCDTSIGIPAFARHYKQKHNEIFLSLSGSGQFLCPIENCGLNCLSGEEYLQHRCSCITQQKQREDEKEKERKKGLKTKWQSDLGIGLLRCANNGCEKQFSCFEKMTSHLKECKTGEMNSYIWNSDGIFCPWDDELIKLEHFNEHLNKKHPQLMEVLTSNKNEFLCPNFNCNTKTLTTQEFIKHTIVCPTCLVCSDCNQTFNLYETYKDHECLANDELFITKSLHLWSNKVRSGQLRCPNSLCDSGFFILERFTEHVQQCSKRSVFCSEMLKRDKIPCSFCNMTLSFNEYITHVQTNHKETEGSTSSNNETSIESQISQWCNNLKDAIYKCPNPNCKQIFKTHESLIPHIKSCEKDKLCKLILNQDMFACCVCKTDVPMSTYAIHFSNSHQKIVSCLKSISYKHCIKCPTTTCRKVFLDTGKFMQHVITCCRFTRKKSLIFKDKWHNEIVNGSLVCPNELCGKKHTFIETFIEHLKLCRFGRNTSKILHMPIPCLICKKHFAIDKLAEHFRTNHTVVFAQLRLVEQGICIHCPNTNCKQAFAYGTAYLQHVATKCKPDNSCGRCNTNFKSYDLLRSHKCNNKKKISQSGDKIWDKISQAPWYEQVMKGDLTCPNSRCSKEFILPRDFVNHLRTCTEGSECAIIVKRNELPCCFCKTYVALGKYCSHLSSCHNQSAKKITQTTLPEKNTVPSQVMAQYFPGFESPSKETSIDTQDQIKRGRNRKAKPRKISTARELNQEDLSSQNDTASTDAETTLPSNSAETTTTQLSTSAEINLLSRRAETTTTQLSTSAEINLLSRRAETTLPSTSSKTILISTSASEITTTEQSDFDASSQEYTDFEVETETQSLVCNLESNTCVKESKNKNEAESRDILSPNKERSITDSAYEDSGAASLGCSPLIENQKIDHEQESFTHDYKLEETDVKNTPHIPHSDVYEKLKNKLKKRPKIKKRLTDDKEVINLVQELLKKKKKKSRFTHRNSICANVGEWTITPKPKRIKTEVCSTDGQGSCAVIDQKSSAATSQLLNKINPAMQETEANQNHPDNILSIPRVEEKKSEFGLIGKIQADNIEQIDIAARDVMTSEHNNLIVAGSDNKSGTINEINTNNVKLTNSTGIEVLSGKSNNSPESEIHFRPIGEISTDNIEPHDSTKIGMMSGECYKPAEAGRKSQNELIDEINPENMALTDSTATKVKSDECKKPTEIKSENLLATSSESSVMDTNKEVIDIPDVKKEDKFSPQELVFSSKIESSSSPAEIRVTRSREGFKRSFASPKNSKRKRSSSITIGEKTDTKSDSVKMSEVSGVSRSKYNMRRCGGLGNSNTDTINLTSSLNNKENVNTRISLSTFTKTSINKVEATKKSGKHKQTKGLKLPDVSVVLPRLECSVVKESKKMYDINLCANVDEKDEVVSSKHQTEAFDEKVTPEQNTDISEEIVTKTVEDKLLVELPNEHCRKESKNVKEIETSFSKVLILEQASNDLSTIEFNSNTIQLQDPVLHKDTVCFGKIEQKSSEVQCFEQESDKLSLIHSKSDTNKVNYSLLHKDTEYSEKIEKTSTEVQCFKHPINGADKSLIAPRSDTIKLNETFEKNKENFNKQSLIDSWSSAANLKPNKGFETALNRETSIESESRTTKLKEPAAWLDTSSVKNMEKNTTETPNDQSTFEMQDLEFSNNIQISEEMDITDLKEANVDGIQDATHEDCIGVNKTEQDTDGTLQNLEVLEFVDTIKDSINDINATKEERYNEKNKTKGLSTKEHNMIVDAVMTKDVPGATTDALKKNAVNKDLHKVAEKISLEFTRKRKKNREEPARTKLSDNTQEIISGISDENNAEYKKPLKISRRFKYSKISSLTTAKKSKPNKTLQVPNKVPRKSIEVDEEQKADLLTLMSLTNDSVVKLNTVNDKHNTTPQTDGLTNISNVTSTPATTVSTSAVTTATTSHMGSIDRPIVIQSFPSVDIPTFETDDDDQTAMDFIDFKIESLPNISVPSSLAKTDTAVCESTLEENLQKTIKNNQSMEGSDNVTTAQEKVRPSSPVFPSLTSSGLASPPLKEMYFLLPKEKDSAGVDMANIEDSQDEGEQENELPNSHLLSNKKTDVKSSLPTLSTNDSKYTQIQESQVIENALQDLLSTVSMTNNALKDLLSTDTMINNASQDLLSEDAMGNVALDTEMNPLERWKKNVEMYHFYCLFDGCRKTFQNPITLWDHMQKCEKNDKGKKWREIVNEMLNCPECEKIFAVTKYARHYRKCHSNLLETLKNLEEGSEVHCLNCKCNAPLTTVDESIHHFRTCGFFEKRLQCSKEFQTKKKRHSCKLNEKSKKILPDDEEISSEQSTSNLHQKKDSLRDSFMEDFKKRNSIIQNISQNESLPLELDTASSSFSNPSMNITLNILDSDKEYSTDMVNDQSTPRYQSLRNNFKDKTQSQFELDDENIDLSLNKNNSGEILKSKISEKSSASSKHLSSSPLCILTASRNVNSPLEAADKNTTAVKSENKKKTYNIRIVDAKVRVENIKYMDTKTWASKVSTYKFICPAKECKEVLFRRISTMVTHIKLCLKKDTKKLKEFLTVSLKCPECDAVCNAKNVNNHFNKEHLLLNWYFEQVELGNWAVCQNYTCAKYMDNQEEIISHYRKCKYLWKCKYCAIEYEDEPSVSKHHCCTSSGDDEDDDDPESKERQKKKRKMKSDAQKSNNKTTKLKSLQNKSSNKTKTNSSILEYDKTLSYCVNLSDWLVTFIELEGKCPVENCSYINVYPIKLLTHVRKCEKTPHNEVNLKIMHDINKMEIKCSIKGCKKSEDVFYMDEYIQHLKNFHLLLMLNLSELQQNGQIYCSNYTCNAELKEAKEVRKHFEECKYLWKCEKCLVEYKSFQSTRTHTCKKIGKVFNLSEDILTDTTSETGNRRKRKSAAKAIDILSGLKKEIEEKKLKKDGNASESGDEEYVAPNESESEDEEDEVISSEESTGESDQPEGRQIRVRSLYDSLFFKEWLKEHATTEFLFPSLLPIKTEISILKDEYKDYIPFATSSPIIEVNYHTKYKTQNTEACSLKLFESFPPLMGSCSLGFNVGGPVQALEWCPMPAEETQYLAVSTHRSYSECHTVIDAVCENGLIQIWKVGNLYNETNEPSMCLGICHKFGPVYDLKWCPSSCSGIQDDDEKNDVLKRLGLLATACGDGKIRIYSIPHPETLSDAKQLFVQMKPALLLIPHKSTSFENNRVGMCVALSWSSFDSHKMIAGGYGDGCIRIWNICTQSIFLRVQDLGGEVLLPPIVINAHSYTIRSLKWCPYNKDVIASASGDRLLKVFNIHQPQVPICSLKRGIIFDIEWPIPRLSIFFTEDDCFNFTPGSARCMLLEQFLREVKKEKEKPYPTTRHNASVFSCSYNNYLDLLVTSDIAGEVMVSVNQENLSTKSMLHLERNQSVYRIERIPIEEKEVKNESSLHSHATDRELDVDSIDFLKEYTKFSDDNLKTFKKYTYKFYDSNKFEFTRNRKSYDPDLKRSSKVKKLNSSDVTQYETRSVRKVTWNQNMGCHTWLASGTRIGIVRLHNFKAWTSSK